MKNDIHILFLFSLNKDQNEDLKRIIISKNEELETQKIKLNGKFYE
jgi:hypothetical protein